MNSGKPKAGIIIAAVVGGIVLIGAIVLAVILYRRRQTANTDTSTDKEDTPTTGTNIVRGTIPKTGKFEHTFTPAIQTGTEVLVMARLTSMTGTVDFYEPGGIRQMHLAVRLQNGVASQYIRNTFEGRWQNDETNVPTDPRLKIKVGEQIKIKFVCGATRYMIYVNEVEIPAYVNRRPNLLDVKQLGVKNFVMEQIVINYPTGQTTILSPE